jgi:hypothetical protein
LDTDNFNQVQSKVAQWIADEFTGIGPSTSGVKPVNFTSASIDWTKPETLNNIAQLVGANGAIDSKGIDKGWLEVLGKLGGYSLTPISTAGQTFGGVPANINMSAKNNGTMADAANMIYGMPPWMLSNLKVAMLINGEAGNLDGSKTLDSYTTNEYDPNFKIAWGKVLKEYATNNIQNYIDQAAQTSYNQAKTTGENGLSWTPTTVSNGVLNQGIGLAEYVAARKAIVSGVLNTVPQLTASGAYQSLSAQFEQQLGRAPTQAELDNFVQQFDSAELSGSKSNALSMLQNGTAQQTSTDLDTGTVLEPKVPKVTQAAFSFATSNNDEYQAHNMGDVLNRAAEIMQSGTTYVPSGAVG